MREKNTLRMALALVFIVLALACAYGLVTSFEPGNSMLWRIGYGFGALTFFSLSVRLGKGS
tara:strand:- start:460 stop:642 length:183 start_codon:yes stop_codon:yes gene_type:complete